MKAFLNLISPRLIEAIGAALLHSLWQSMLVAVVLWLALRAFRDASPHLRYTLCIAAFALMALIPVATGVQIYFLRPAAIDLTLRILPNDAHNPVAPYALPEGEASHTADAIENADTLPSPASIRTFPIAAEILFIAARPFIVFFWMLGVLILSIRLSGGLFEVSRLRRNSKPLIDSSIDALYIALVTRMDIGRSAMLRTSSETDQPLLVGWLKPMILLPTSLLTGIHPEHSRVGRGICTPSRSQNRT